MASIDYHMFKEQIMLDYEEVFNEQTEEEEMGFEEVDTSHNKRYRFAFEYDISIGHEEIRRLNRINLEKQKQFMQDKAQVYVFYKNFFQRHKKLETQFLFSKSSHPKKLTIYHIYWDII